MPMQALKARGEPLLSGFETTSEGITACFAPLRWQLTELLSPKYGASPCPPACIPAGRKQLQHLRQLFVVLCDAACFMGALHWLSPSYPGLRISERRGYLAFMDQCNKLL